MQGKFITLEGTDGCGKSTQTKMLLEYLKGKNIKTVYTREPGGTEIGEKIREVALDKNLENMHSMTELLLMIAARIQHINEIILPAIEKGEWVICDRFTDATIAYQAYGSGVDINCIYRLLKEAGCILKPDLTFFIDIDITEGLSRLTGEKDRFESKGIDYLEAVRRGYKEIAKQEPERVKVLDGALDREVVSKEIQEYINVKNREK
jgi:dTMP kinase